MKIINHTKWDTKHLQKILRWCLKREGQIGKNLTVEIVNGRRWKSNFVGGYAYYGKGDYGYSNYMRLKIPVNGEITDKRVADTFLHELAHTRGERHKDMVEPDIPFEEIGMSFLVRKAEKSKPDLIHLRHDKTKKKVREYEIKLKRTENLLKKWRKKEKYYMSKVIKK